MSSNKGESNLSQLIKNMQPILNEGEYVFATLSDLEGIPRARTIAEFREQEGHTVVVSKLDAELYGLKYDFVAAWITLNIHSSLSAVGLTAAFATALGQNDISCNVIAAYYHDHIFVDVKDKDKAMSVLLGMSKDAC